MQNIENLSYIKKSNIINLKSEMLFREAEDDFFYFNNINGALKKLKSAIKLTPHHSKSLMLCADIHVMKGQFKQALKLYYLTFCLNNKNNRAVAALANCYYGLKDFSNAVMYSDLALGLIENDNFALYSQLIEIKINSLLELKNYKSAYKVFIKSKNYLESNSLKNIYNSNFELINEKLKLQKRLEQVNLKIV